MVSELQSLLNKLSGMVCELYGLISQLSAMASELYGLVDELYGIVLIGYLTLAVSYLQPERDSLGSLSAPPSGSAGTSSPLTRRPP